MPSQESKALADVLALLKGFMAGGLENVEFHRLILEELHSVGSEPTDVTYEEVHCPGTIRPAIWCKPLGASPSQVILYFHGGGWVGGSPSSLRKTAAHLAKETGAYALLIDYRRAPEHQFPSQIEDAVDAYKWLISECGISSKRIAFAGDSAGGSLAISVPLKLRELGLPLPAAIVGFSPWLDVRQTGDSYVANVETDGVANVPAVQQLQRVCFGNASLEHPLIDLLNADLKGFPPLSLVAGGAELIRDDAVLFAKHARAQGIETELEISEGMQHVYIFLAGRAPEAKHTLSRVGSWLKQKLGAT